MALRQRIRKAFLEMEQRDWTIFVFGLILFAVSMSFLLGKYINLPF